MDKYVLWDAASANMDRYPTFAFMSSRLRSKGSYAPCIAAMQIAKDFSSPESFPTAAHRNDIDFFGCFIELTIHMQTLLIRKLRFEGAVADR